MFANTGFSAGCVTMWLTLIHVYIGAHLVVQHATLLEICRASLHSVTVPRPYYYDVPIASYYTAFVCRACSHDFYAKCALSWYSRRMIAGCTETAAARYCVTFSFRSPERQLRNFAWRNFGANNSSVRIYISRDTWAVYVNLVNEAYGGDITRICPGVCDYRRYHTPLYGCRLRCSLIKRTDYVINYSRFNRVTLNILDWWTDKQRLPCQFKCT